MSRANRFRRGFLSSLIVLLVCSGAESTCTTADAEDTAHPRLYVTAADVQRVRQRMSAGQLQELAQRPFTDHLDGLGKPDDGRSWC